MEKDIKITQSNNKEVQYRRAKTWHIALSQLNAGSGTIFMLLIGMMSYLANAGYGIAVAIVGLILTGARIFDGIVDPFIALFIDKFNTRFGKIRILMLIGWVIRAFAALLLFVWASGKNHGVVFFIIMYMVYIFGSSIVDVVSNIIGPIMTNDPKQRPTINVWSTVYNYLIPMIFSLITTLVILPRYGNEYTVSMLATTCILYVAASFVFMIISFIGISPIDKPENFVGITQDDDIKVKDMVRFVKDNRPFQMYLISGASDKIAQQVTSQAVVSTMLFGILMGDIQFGSILSMASMLPSIIFAILGAKYAGKYGNKKATVNWTFICTVIATITIVFCAIIDMRTIPSSLLLTVIFFALSLMLNGAKMCVTTANGAMRADVIDYELDRTGKYLPAVATAAYNFVDKIISSFSSTIALGIVALIGYKSVMPQPTDEPNSSIFIVSMFLYFGLPILGWITTLIAMKFYHLTKEEMVEVQKRINEKKEALQPAK